MAAAVKGMSHQCSRDLPNEKRYRLLDHGQEQHAVSENRGRLRSNGESCTMSRDTALTGTDRLCRLSDPRTMSRRAGFNIRMCWNSSGGDPLGRQTGRGPPPSRPKHPED